MAFAAFRHRKAEKKVFLNFTLKVCEGSGKSQFPQTFFFLYFWGQKYQKPPHVVLCGSARAAALHGARKIKPMRHPVTGAPQPAPSFSASNESADLLCRHRRHCLYMAMRPGSLYQLTFPEISIRQCVSLFSARRSPTWFRWRKSGRRAESDSGGDGLLANPRIVARRRFQPSGRRHRNRLGGFCCFSPPKSREKSFPKFYAESLRGFREVAVPTNFFLLVLLGPKVPKASARRSLRECASRGAARGAQDQAYALPRDERAAARTLFLRVKRECGFIVPPTAALIVYIWQCASIPNFYLFFLRKVIPDLVPMAKERPEG